MSDESSSLNEGEIHDILRNDRRRAVIDFLSEHGGHATIRELSEHIATLESGEDPPPRNVRQSVYVSLHQTHLPKLQGLGVVDYDTDSKDIDLRERATRLEAYMDRKDSDTDPLSLIYVAIGTIGILLTLMALGSDGSVVGIGLSSWVLPLFVIVVGLGIHQTWIR